jgi:HK97 family phage major capsid protein
MKTQELQSKVNKLMVDAHALINKENVTTEDRSNFDRMIADASVLREDIRRVESIESFAKEQEQRSRPPREGFGNEDKSDATAKAEKRAFEEWMRYGQVSSENRSLVRTVTENFEQRDLGAAVGATGNALVPVGFDPTFHGALLDVGELVGAVGQLTTSGGGPIDVATENDTARGLTLISEATAVVENDPTIAGFQSFTDTATSGLVAISNQLLQDSQFDLNSWIQDKLAAAYYRGLNTWISAGNGSNVQALGSTLGATSAAPTTIGYSDLTALFGSLQKSYRANAVWVMSSQTQAALMSSVSATTNQPILQTDAQGNPYNAIFGKPLVINESQAAIAATNKPILFGNLKEGYTLRKAGNFGIKRLNELLALKNQTGFVLFCRVGGYNTDAGTHPVRSLTMHT